MSDASMMKRAIALSSTAARDGGGPFGGGQIQIGLSIKRDLAFMGFGSCLSDYPEEIQ
jgi:hypothetical protein